MLFQWPWWKCCAQTPRMTQNKQGLRVPHKALCVWDISKHGCRDRRSSLKSYGLEVDTLPKEQQHLWLLALKLDEMSHLSWPVDQAGLYQVRKWVLKISLRFDFSCALLLEPVKVTHHGCPGWTENFHEHTPLGVSIREFPERFNREDTLGIQRVLFCGLEIPDLRQKKQPEIQHSILQASCLYLQYDRLPHVPATVCFCTVHRRPNFISGLLLNRHCGWVIVMVNPGLISGNQ